MALVNLSKVDPKNLKEMVKLLNPILDEKKMEKIKVVGIKPQAMADGFTVQVEALADANLTDELKAKAPSVIEFYNALAFIEKGVSEWAAKTSTAPATAPATATAPTAPTAEGTTVPAPAEEVTAPVTKVKKEKVPKPPKAPKAPKAPRAGNPAKTGIMSKPLSWEDLQKRLSTPATPTAYMDYLTMMGGKLEDLVKTFQEWRAKNAPDYAAHFRNPSGIRSHIEYRKTTGWIYEEKDGAIKLVGYTPVVRKVAAPAAPAAPTVVPAPAPATVTPEAPKA